MAKKQVMSGGGGGGSKTGKAKGRQRTTPDWTGVPF
jgi:hypothetical protein